MRRTGSPVLNQFIVPLGTDNKIHYHNKNVMCSNEGIIQVRKGLQLFYFKIQTNINTMIIAKYKKCYHKSIKRHIIKAQRTRRLSFQGFGELFTGSGAGVGSSRSVVLGGKGEGPRGQRRGCTGTREVGWRKVRIWGNGEGNFWGGRDGQDPQSSGEAMKGVLSSAQHSELGFPEIMVGWPQGCQDGEAPLVVQEERAEDPGETQQRWRISKR